MIPSYEVGAIFRIQDDATPTLLRLTTEATRLDGVITTVKANLASLGRVPGITQLSRQLGGLARQVDRIATGARGMASSTAGALAPLRTELSLVTQEVHAMTAALAQAAGAARGLRVPRAPSAGGGGRGGGHGGGLHVSSFGIPTPGGHAHVRGGNAAMAGLGAIAYGIYQEAEVEDIAARAFITGQMKVDAGMTQTDAYKELRSIITKNAISGGFAPKEVGEAVLGSERQFAGLPFRKRMEVLNTMIPYAMQEARLKETPLKESAEALVGLAHMTGTYDTDKLPGLYRKFAYASQLTPKSLPQYTNALSYAMPSLVGGMGMDPDAIMFLTAMNQAAGIGSSKAGTWIQAFFSRLVPASGINLTRSQTKHNEALREAGLTDTAGNLTWQVKRGDGTVDWLGSLEKLAPMLGSKLSGMDAAHRLTWIEGVFGKQGGREAGLMNLPEFIGQFPQLARQLKMAQGGEDVLKEYREGSPVQQARTAWSELTVVLMDLATVALPPVTAALREFSGVIKTIGSYLPNTPASSTAAGGGPSMWSIIGKRAVEGGIVGGVGGAFVGGVGALPGFGVGLATGAAFGAAEWLAGGKAPAAVGFPAAPGQSGALAPANAASGGTMSVTVKAETDNPEALARAVASKLAEIIAAGSQHNLAQGQGALSSPYNSGNPLP